MLRTAAAAAADQMDAGHETAGVDSEIASTTTSPTIITITSNTATSTTISRDQPPGVSSLAAVEAASEASLPPSPSTNLARDRKVASLKSHIASLEKQLEEVRSKQADVDSKLKNPTNPGATVKRHISLLHEFNEIRDVAQGLLGLVAEGRGVRVQDIYSEFGLDDGD